MRAALLRVTMAVTAYRPKSQSPSDRKVRQAVAVCPMDQPRVRDLVGFALSAFVCCVLSLPLAAALLLQVGLVVLSVFRRHLWASTAVAEEV